MKRWFQAVRYCRHEDLLRAKERLSELTGEECVVIPPDVEPIAPRTLYLCDRRCCERCSPDCSYTEDISHAAHFTRDMSGIYIEQPGGDSGGTV